MLEKIRFDGRLESLRGLAALIVASHHGLCAFVDKPTYQEWTIRSDIVSWYCWITNPGASVIFFFVLSGYVLGGSINANPAFVPYFIRRLVRILPMFLISVLFAYFCITAVRTEPPTGALGDFFQATFFPGPTPADLVDNLMMRAALVNGPSWSIHPELLGSLMLPPLVFAHQSVARNFRWILFILFCVTLAFTGFRLILWFYIGFFLPPEIARWVGRRFSLAISLFFVGYLILWYTVLNYPFSFSARVIIPTAIGASLMIGSVLSDRSFMAWLDRKSPRFLGKISYSFYLLHWPIFYLCWAAYMQTSLPRDGVGNLIISSTSIISTLAASRLTYMWVESPTMSAGKILANFLQRQNVKLFQWPARGQSGLSKNTETPKLS